MSGVTHKDETMDCGCSIGFEPCLAHQASLSAGEQKVVIEVEFFDRHSRFAGNKHNVNLERVQRIELGIDDEEMVFDENSIADMLQKVADERPYESGAFILRALANALRGDDDYHKLELRQLKRGAWQSPSDKRARHRRHLAWILRLNRLQSRGWPREAAVHRIAESTGKSVSTIYSGIAEELEWQDILRRDVRAIKLQARRARPEPPIKSL